MDHKNTFQENAIKYLSSVLKQKSPTHRTVFVCYLIIDYLIGLPYSLERLKEVTTIYYYNLPDGTYDVAKIAETKKVQICAKHVILFNTMCIKLKSRSCIVRWAKLTYPYTCINVFNELKKSLKTHDPKQINYCFCNVVLNNLHSEIKSGDVPLLYLTHMVNYAPRKTYNTPYILTKTDLYEYIKKMCSTYVELARYVLIQ